MPRDEHVEFRRHDWDILWGSLLAYRAHCLNFCNLGFYIFPRTSCCAYMAGPRDDEFSGRKFSFVRYSSICAILPNSEAYEEAARSAGALQAELSKATGGLKF